MDLFTSVGRAVTGRRAAWLVLLVALIGSFAIITTAGEPVDPDEEVSILPASAESKQAAIAVKQLPDGNARSAIVVYSKGGETLTRADVRAIDARSAVLGDLVGTEVGPARLADERQAAVVVVPIQQSDDTQKTVDLVKAMRAESASGLPAGVVAEVTGSAGFRADIYDSFSGANTRLLLVTLLVVAVLLLVTYRSPILWLVPLTVVAIADRVAGSAVDALSSATGLVIDGSTSGILDILVFGAGTNYALLLIARYREELRHVDDVHVAMRAALRGAGPAILASAATVALSLLVLMFAVLPNDRAVGMAGAMAIAIAAVFALLVLPAALVVCGRKLFWPFIPRVGDPDPTRTGGWWKIATYVAERPVRVTAISLVFLLALSSGLFAVKLGVSQTDRFRVQSEAVDGQKTLERYFPAGAGDPVVVVTSADRVAEVEQAVEAVPGVVSVNPGAQADGIARVDLVIDSAPSTDGAFETVRAVRDVVHAIDGADALVGGSTAVDLDWKDSAARDFKFVVPLVLLVVALVLIVLLRSLVAPFVLVGTVVLTFLAALGAGVLAFEHVFDFGGLAVNVPVLSFLFLVALGVDYNIFLATRAREETASVGTRDGIVTAVAVTGGVITSAGILLASVFIALAVLPIIMLTEIGVVVGFGVLLDTLLVRTVLVPALVVLIGDRFWWPRHPAHEQGAAAPSLPEPVHEHG